jgi:cob(I)alamin adenosyltransferase
MVKLYTKTGDSGETGLLYGGRVPKTDPRVEAYGTLDEANSTLGLARALTQDPRVKGLVERLQRDLFKVGAELATDHAARDTFLAHFEPVTAEMTTHLEHTIDELTLDVQLPRAFIIPGASPASAALDIARSAIRRAERRVVTLQEKGLIANNEILRYLNRLADLLFILARYQDRQLPLESLTGERA